MHAAHGKTLMSVGDYLSATSVLQQSLKHSLYVAPAQHSPAAKLAVIDARIELGILYRLKSDLPRAKQNLLRAQEDLGHLESVGEDTASRNQSVILQLLWCSQVEGSQIGKQKYAEWLNAYFEQNKGRASAPHPPQLSEVFKRGWCSRFWGKQSKRKAVLFRHTNAS